MEGGTLSGCKFNPFNLPNDWVLRTEKKKTNHFSSLISFLRFDKSRLNSLLFGIICRQKPAAKLMHLQLAYFSRWCCCWLLHAAPLTHSLNYVSNNNFSRIDIRDEANIFLIIQTPGWWCSICRLDVLATLLECYNNKQNKCDDRPHLHKGRRVCICVRTCQNTFSSSSNNGEDWKKKQ